MPPANFFSLLRKPERKGNAVFRTKNKIKEILIKRIQNN
jgi:hypothetical protein